MVTWNQPELWRRVPNIRWVCSFFSGLSKVQALPRLLFASFAQVLICRQWEKYFFAPFHHLGNILSGLSGKQERRPQLQSSGDDWRAEVCRADGNQPVWDECEREHQRRRGNIQPPASERSQCLSWVVSWTLISYFVNRGSVQLKVVLSEYCKLTLMLHWLSFLIVIFSL